MSLAEARSGKIELVLGSVQSDMTMLLLPIVLISVAVPPAFGQVAAPPAQATVQQAMPLGEELPVSLERIRRKLAEPQASATGGGLRLAYRIEVFGRAPAIDLFTNFDLQRGPVPDGSPTHAEFLHLVTPQEFRSPAADLMTPAMALIHWLARQRGAN